MADSLSALKYRVLSYLSLVFACFVTFNALAQDRGLVIAVMNGGGTYLLNNPFRDKAKQSILLLKSNKDDSFETFLRLQCQTNEQQYSARVD